MIALAKGVRAGTAWTQDEERLLSNFLAALQSSTGEGCYAELDYQEEIDFGPETAAVNFPSNFPQFPDVSIHRHAGRYFLFHNTDLIREGATMLSVVRPLTAALNVNP